MKLIKKLVIGLFVSVCAALICVSVTACGGTSSGGGESLADGVYEFYVYLADGTTPATSTTFAICYDTAADESVCMTASSLDENGRAEVDLSSRTIYNGGIYFHFGALTPGYTYPTDSYTVTLADGSQYQHAYKITQQSNTFVLVAQS